MSEENHFIYEFGPFRLDAQKRLLFREGEPVKLFPKEFDTLLALVERSRDILDKDELMRMVWGESIVEEGTLTTNISHLRKVLGEKPNQHQYIVTVPGKGYQFVAGVSTAGFDEVLVHERTRAELTIEEDAPITDYGLRFADSGDVALTVPGSSALTEQSAIRIPQSALRRALAAGVLLFLLIGAVGFWFYKNWPDRQRQAGTVSIPFQQINIRRLNVNGDPRGGATLSPDGKLFAYVLMNSEGKQTLWLGHVDGGEPVQLRPSAEVLYLSLTFAPDGSSLYYTAADGYSSDGALYKMPVFGGVAERVKDNVRRRITFSPDGKQFAFVRPDGAGRRSVLVIADTKGTSEREIASRPSHLAFFQQSPSWSPDGNLIAVGAVDDRSDQDCEIFVVSVEDGSIKPLTKGAWKEILRTEWFNDSIGLIAVAYDIASSPDSQLWHISYPNGEARRIITDLTKYGSSVNLSADNKNLLAVRVQRQTNIWIAAANDLGNTKQITFDPLGRTNGALGLDWTPDGRLVFTAFVGQYHTLWTVDADGSNKKQLLPSGYMNLYPTVTHDGRYVVYQSDQSGSPKIWRANLDGSDMRQLTTNGDDSHPHVSPDGKWVVYESGGDGVRALWRISIDGGTPVRLAAQAASWPRISPDGKLVACVYGSGLGILPAEGGRPIKFFNVPRLANFNNGLRWTPDSKAITYRDTANGVWKQSLEGGEPRRLEGLPQEKLFSYGWSRDGKLFAFARGTELREVVLIRDLK
ncbi:MAG: winged helix-turn-helix domain-containing protein [Acidobacteriota bacterium]